MGDSVYQSGMCLNCYKEYLENTGGQTEGHNPPAYTRGLIKAAKASEVSDTLNSRPDTSTVLLLLLVTLTSNPVELETLPVDAQQQADLGIG